jgi:hypothetical protein
MTKIKGYLYHQMIQQRKRQKGEKIQSRTIKKFHIMDLDMFYYSLKKNYGLMRIMLSKFLSEFSNIFINHNHLIHQISFINHNHPPFTFNCSNFELHKNFGTLRDLHRRRNQRNSEFWNCTWRNKLNMEDYEWIYTNSASYFLCWIYVKC